MKNKQNNILATLARILGLWLPLKIRYDDTPGISVAVAHKGKTVYAKGFGYADLEKKIRATADTKYRIASISKMFTAVAIMQLQEKGRLKLSDPISKYLPWFEGKNEVGNLNKITIKQLLSHSSGIIRDGRSGCWENDKFPKSLERITGPDDVIFKSPARFKYSNHGYAILGEVIKEVSGIPYGEYVKKFVTKPLSLKNTSPDLPSKSQKNLAKGYTRFVPGQKITAFKHVPTNAYASATGFVSTAGDVAKFLSFLVSKNSTKVLSYKSKKAMMRPWATNNKDTKYGFGMELDRVSKRWVVGHSGGFAGFILEAVADSKNELVAVVLTNRLGASAFDIAMSVLGFFYYLLDAPHTAKKIKNSVRYEGVYRNRWSDSVVIGLPAFLFRFSALSNRPYKNPGVLVPKSGNQFTVKEDGGFSSIGETAIFDKFKKGKAQRMSISGAPLKRVIQR